jgi:RimJ/RimL family protein N-acetyltransferase
MRGIQYEVFVGRGFGPNPLTPFPQEKGEPHARRFTASLAPLPFRGGAGGEVQVSPLQETSPAPTSDKDSVMRVFLETERLALLQFTEDDVDNLVELDSDPEVMRYLNGGIPTPRELVEREILPRFLSYYERYDGFGVWAAVEKSSGAFIGWFSLRPHDESRPNEVELGYRLRRSSWGQGYATEGARALIRKGFTELGAQRVTANTYEHNTGSRRVMEKAGMTLVRRYRPTLDELTSETSNHLSADSVWDGDEVEYALTKSDWETLETTAASGQDENDMRSG